MNNFKFRFSDEELQDKFYKAMKEFKKMFPQDFNFSIPVSINDAKSVVEGKYNDDLKKALDVYNKDKTGYNVKHEVQIMKEIQKRSGGVQKLMIELRNLVKRMDYDKKKKGYKWNEKNQYNVLWYDTYKN